MTIIFPPISPALHVNTSCLSQWTVVVLRLQVNDLWSSHCNAALYHNVSVCIHSTSSMVLCHAVDTRWQPAVCDLRCLLHVVSLYSLIVLRLSLTAVRPPLQVSGLWLCCGPLCDVLITQISLSIYQIPNQTFLFNVSAGESAIDDNWLKLKVMVYVSGLIKPSPRVVGGGYRLWRCSSVGLSVCSSVDRYPVVKVTE